VINWAISYFRPVTGAIPEAVATLGPAVRVRVRPQPTGSRLGLPISYSNSNPNRDHDHDPALQ